MKRYCAIIFIFLAFKFFINKQSIRALIECSFKNFIAI